MKRFKKAFLRNLLLIIALLGFALVLFLNRSDLDKTWDLLKNVSLVSVLILPVMQLVSYFFISQYYRSFILQFGGKISNWRAFGTTSALNFVNQILPSGGGSGLTYLIYAFKDKAKPGQLTLIQLGRYTLAFLTYIPLLIVAFVWLLVTGELNQQLGILLTVLFLISLPGTVIFIVALRHRDLVDKVVGWFLKLANKIVMFFTRKQRPPIEISRRHGFLKDFHDGVEFIQKQGRKIVRPLMYMQLSTIAEVSIVILAFWVLGVNISPAVILVAFTAANVVGVISVIPGDVGVHELAVITVLAYVGVPEGSALAGTLLYRVFNKIVIMSIGFMFYVKIIKPLVKNVRPTA
jgi:uncharacterized protein (TIRG00374 family)